VEKLFIVLVYTSYLLLPSLFQIVDVRRRYHAWETADRKGPRLCVSVPSHEEKSAHLQNDPSYSVELSDISVVEIITPFIISSKMPPSIHPDVLNRDV
jgi:hypothetical protein